MGNQVVQWVVSGWSARSTFAHETVETMWWWHWCLGPPAWQNKPCRSRVYTWTGMQFAGLAPYSVSNCYSSSFVRQLETHRGNESHSPSISGEMRQLVICLWISYSWNDKVVMSFCHWFVACLLNVMSFHSRENWTIQRCPIGLSDMMDICQDKAQVIT